MQNSESVFFSHKRSFHSCPWLKILIQKKKPMTEGLSINDSGFQTQVQSISCGDMYDTVHWMQTGETV